MKADPSIDKNFAERHSEDRLRANETGVVAILIEEEPCVVEIRGRVPNRVGRSFL